MNTVTVDNKGRILIPLAEREALDIKPGDELVVVREGTRLRVLPISEVLDALATEAMAEYDRGETIPLRRFVAEAAGPDADGVS